MNAAAAIEKIESQINKVNEILHKGAWKDDPDVIDEYRDSIIFLKEMMKAIYSDSKQRIQDYNISIQKAVSHDHQRDGRVQRKSFQEEAKATRRYLCALKDHLEINDKASAIDSESPNTNKKLDKLKGKIEERQMEAQRREVVTEGKVYGAAMEMIDRLRDELKRQEENTKEIRSMKEEIESIKEDIIQIKDGIQIIIEALAELNAQESQNSESDNENIISEADMMVRHADNDLKF